MAKCDPKLTPDSGQKGQISIFFSASLVILISIIAFVINIGLFVKAKINLQNATDAAAYAGAAVQARQLTKIGYLNWEMRNIYKEWMFKYYVIGNLNIEDVENPSGSGAMSFRMQGDRDAITGVTETDPYNIPAVCIHIAGSSTNLCKRFGVPGLPEFGGYNLPGAEEASRVFLDNLISTKSTNCADRSKLNMLVATTWTYNVLTQNPASSIVTQGPAILADRQGAWPRAVELALRMRNLEYVMNKKPYTGGICKDQGGGISCAVTIDQIADQGKELGNERAVKAFFSGYRNLGNDIDDEMKNSFTLTELAPNITNLGNERSGSYLLIPQNNRYQKSYVDLKLMMINYAIFYDAFIPAASAGRSAACDVSKVAIPVPGYPMGFYKNPDLVTYYAVKGEANFVGMFNPFGGESIKLTAYAAAKPFGGRIGPMLFYQGGASAEGFIGRQDDSKKSVPYLASLDTSGTIAKRGQGATQIGSYTSGEPMPINFATNPGYFWLQNAQSYVGGRLSDPNAVQFGIPNLVYDYVDSTYSNAKYIDLTSSLHVIKSSPGSVDKPVGLYNKEMFAAFKGPNLSPGSPVSVDVLRDEIARIKAPTAYDAANYLVPTPDDFNKDKKIESFGFISGQSRPLGNGVKQYDAYIYAPLYKNSLDQTDILFESATEVVSTIFEFMREQESAVLKYKASLNTVAKSIFDNRNIIAGTAAVGSAQGYADAAAKISNIPNFSASGSALNDAIPQDCSSLAGLFLAYYLGAPDLYPAYYKTGCPTTLGEMIKQYFSSPGRDFSVSHYHMEYSWLESNFPKSIQNPKSFQAFSAYMPGPFNGISEEGEYSSPISGSSGSEMMRRNSYSTKFVTLKSVTSSGGYNHANSNFSTFSEGTLNEGVRNTKQNSFANALDPSSFPSEIKH